MKLSSILLKGDVRIPDLAITKFTASETIDLSFESGIVTIRRLDRPDEEPFLVPFANLIYMRPLTKAKAVAAAA